MINTRPSNLAARPPIETPPNQVPAWARVIITRLVALVPPMAVALISGAAAGSTALDSLNQVLNLLQSVQLPFA
jgi:hypothetical protein